MGGLVQRLRKIATQTDDSTATEAADRIEAQSRLLHEAKDLQRRLLAEAKRLEAALREIAEDAEDENRMLLSVGHSCGDGYLDIKGKARRALEGK